MTMTTTRVAICCLLVALGCAGNPGSNTPQAASQPRASSSASGESLAPAAPESPATAQTPEEDTLPEGAPKVTLLEAGAEPRTPLRYAPTKLDGDGLLMIMKMDMEISSAGQPLPRTKLPAMVIEMDFRDISVAEDGTMSATFELTGSDVKEEPDVTPAVVTAMRQSLETMEGLRGYQQVSSRGVTTKLEMSYPPNMTPSVKETMDHIRESMTQLSPVLPKEAIGVGARWTTETTITINGITSTQTSTYKVIRREGALIDMKVTVMQHAGEQQMPGDGLPAGATMTLIEMKGEATGQLSFDMSRLAPVRSTLELRLQTRAEITVSGDTQPVVVKMTMTTDIQGK